MNQRHVLSNLLLCCLAIVLAVCPAALADGQDLLKMLADQEPLAEDLAETLTAENVAEATAAVEEMSPAEVEQAVLEAGEQKGGLLQRLGFSEKASQLRTFVSRFAEKNELLRELKKFTESEEVDAVVKASGGVAGASAMASLVAGILAKRASGDKAKKWRGIRNAMFALGACATLTGVHRYWKNGQEDGEEDSAAAGHSFKKDVLSPVLQTTACLVGAIGVNLLLKKAKRSWMYHHHDYFKLVRKDGAWGKLKMREPVFYLPLSDTGLENLMRKDVGAYRLVEGEGKGQSFEAEDGILGNGLRFRHPDAAIRVEKLSEVLKRNKQATLTFWVNFEQYPSFILGQRVLEEKVPELSHEPMSFFLAADSKLYFNFNKLQSNGVFKKEQSIEAYYRTMPRGDSALHKWRYMAVVIRREGGEYLLDTHVSSFDWGEGVFMNQGEHKTVRVPADETDLFGPAP